MVVVTKFLFVAALAMAVVGVAQAAAPTPLKPLHTWSGSVDDEKLQKEMPKEGFISDAKAFDALVKAWKVADKVPEIDFTKEVVLISTTVGSKLNLNASLDEKGDLKAVGFGTRDIAPGFRYVIISVSRDGVKTINGNALTK